MPWSRRFIALPVLLMTPACPDYSYKPAGEMRVLGFATTCDGGASARLAHFDGHDGALPELAIETDALHAGEAKLAIASHAGLDGNAFVMAVNDSTFCTMPTTSPEPLVEADCYREGEAATRCKARLNLQGYRPAPPRYDRSDINVGTAYGDYKTLAPENLFDVQDFDTALSLHTVMHRVSLKIDCGQGASKDP